MKLLRRLAFWRKSTGSYLRIGNRRIRLDDTSWMEKNGIQDFSLTMGYDLDPLSFESVTPLPFVPGNISVSGAFTMLPLPEHMPKPTFFDRLRRPFRRV